MSLFNRSVSRRAFIKAGVATGLVATAGMGWTASLIRTAFSDDLVTTSYTIATEKWPKNTAPLRVAFISDLHVGSGGITFETLERLVDQVNSLKPDLILIGGDYLTNLHPHYWMSYLKPEPIAAKLKPLSAPLGVISVLGNHDWMCDGPGMRAALEDNGVTVLDNQTHSVRHKGQNIWIAGLADFLTRTPLYTETLSHIPDGEPVIVLSHDPYTFKDATTRSVIQLSGHTHGGQVTLPLAGPVATPTPGTPKEWFYGLVNDNNRHMIVTSGIGTSLLPVKNTPKEIVLLQLHNLNSPLEPASHTG